MTSMTLTGVSLSLADKEDEDLDWAYRYGMLAVFLAAPLALISSSL